MAWSVALIEAKFGPAEHAQESIAPAHALNASAAAALLQHDGDSHGSPWSWFWRGEEASGGSDEADHIACLHISAWQTIEGYREMLQSVDRFADGAPKHVSMDDYRHRIAALSEPEGYLGEDDLERAEEVLDMVWEETTDRLQKIELARQALAISPLCVSGYIVLASYANFPPTEKLLAWGNGVAAGAKVLGKRYFEEEIGYFWGDHDSRDYMRARQGLALELWDQGRRVEAIDHLKELLRLNPKDGQRNLYVLLPWLIQLDRDDEIEGLLEVWCEGHDQSVMQRMTMIMWTRTLVAFRRDPATAIEPLVAAMKCNPFVPAYLFWDKHPNKHFRVDYGYGTPEEANEYAVLALDAWSTEARSWVDVTLAALAMNPVGNDPSRTHFRH